ncbi:hypothetical protein AB205_0095700 [Aquarana catesbeiana]|uniref:CWH43-like N-terminal domain-containing protein n=1 Tax=Aquarana catesbeiana TaxID=8400 RepID=A0A2G9RGL1_AQUCT|nr:hypothetical protein AB205_0095700 [Aquarana catesbeiana]
MIFFVMDFELLLCFLSSGAATMYVRYKIVLEQNNRSAFLCRYFNSVSLAIGIIGCIGMGIVASFQETSVTKVHDAGALATFGCGVIYILLQSIISYKSCPEWNRRVICHIRMSISVLSCLAVFPSFRSAQSRSVPGPRCWGVTQPSPYHQASAVCEWIVAFGFVTFFLTFIRDFQVGITIDCPCNDV